MGEIGFDWVRFDNCSLFIVNIVHCSLLVLTGIVSTETWVTLYTDYMGNTFLGLCSLSSAASCGAKRRTFNRAYLPFSMVYPAQ